MMERLTRSREAIYQMIVHAETALDHDKYFKSMNVERDHAAYKDAVLMQLGQVGEHCSLSKLSEKTREEYSHISWSQIKGFRNEAYHRYENLDYDTAWYIVDHLLEDLISNLEEILKDLDLRIRELD